jgi:hypothetical protein
MVDGCSSIGDEHNIETKVCPDTIDLFKADLSGI